MNSIQLNYHKGESIIKILFLIFVVALALSGVAGSLHAQEVCRVTVTAEGKFTAVFEGPTINYSLPQFYFVPARNSVIRNGSDALCNRNNLMNSGTDFSFPNRDQDERYFHLLNETAGSLARGGLKGFDPHFDEFEYAIRSARKSILREAVSKGAVELGFKVMSQHPAIKGLNVPRSLLLNAIQEFIKAGMAGGPEGLEKAALAQAIALAKNMGIEDELLKSFTDAVLLGFKIVETEIKKDPSLKPQSMTGFADTDNCSWMFYSWWNPMGGDFHMRFQKECGEENDKRAISSATLQFIPNQAEPGDAVTVSVTASDFRGNPVQVKNIEVDGLKAIMEDGADFVVGGVPGFLPRVQFNVAKPRWDKSYPLKFEITDVENNRITLNEDYQILNVNPEISELEPNFVSADPGEMIGLNNVNLIVTDNNADQHNLNELQTDRIRLSGEPEGLQTDPTISEFDDINRESFKPETGTYTFLLSRSGTVRLPHPHGDHFTNLLFVQDDQGEEDQASLTYKVNNVAPAVERTRIEPNQYLDSHNPIEITFQAVISDNNGREDIELIEVNATNAAATQQIFTLENGLHKEEQDEHTIRIFTDSFTHTITPGNHTLPLEIRDKPDTEGLFNTTNASDWIHVGNLSPEIGAHGFIWDAGNPEALLVTSSEKLPCPGEIITVGAQVSDAENHNFTVTATLNGQQVELTKAPGETTYVGTLIAPGPGEYTIRIDTQETVYDQQKGESKSLPLTVRVCTENEEEHLVSSETGTGDIATPDEENIPESTSGQPDPEEKEFATGSNETGKSELGNLSPAIDFSNLNGTAGFKFDFATRNRFKDAVCDQQGLMNCETDKLTPVFVAFGEFRILDVDLTGYGAGFIPLSGGISFSRSTVNSEQYYQYGVAGNFPYEVTGKTTITSLDLYTKIQKEFNPIKGFPASPRFSPYFRIGLSRFWNRGKFNFFSSNDNYAFNRKHSGINLLAGLGTDIGFNGPLGARLNLDYTAGGADANWRFGLGATYRF